MVYPIAYYFININRRDDEVLVVKNDFTHSSTKIKKRILNFFFLFRHTSEKKNFFHISQGKWRFLI